MMEGDYLKELLKDLDQGEINQAFERQKTAAARCRFFMLLGHGKQKLLFQTLGAGERGELEEHLVLGDGGRTWGNLSQGEQVRLWLHLGPEKRALLIGAGTKQLTLHQQGELLFSLSQQYPGESVQLVSAATSDLTWLAEVYLSVPNTLKRSQLGAHLIAVHGDALLRSMAKLLESLNYKSVFWGFKDHQIIHNLFSSDCLTPEQQVRLLELLVDDSMRFKVLIGMPDRQRSATWERLPGRLKRQTVEGGAAILNKRPCPRDRACLAEELPTGGQVILFESQDESMDQVKCLMLRKNNWRAKLLWDFLPEEQRVQTLQCLARLADKWILDVQSLHPVIANALLQYLELYRPDLLHYIIKSSRRPFALRFR
jgi:hypothetical protein